MRWKRGWSNELRRLRARIERLEARIPDPESESDTVNIEDDPMYLSILAWGRVADGLDVDGSSR
jgi:hypothetical protein